MSSPPDGAFMASQHWLGTIRPPGGPIDAGTAPFARLAGADQASAGGGRRRTCPRTLAVRPTGEEMRVAKAQKSGKGKADSKGAAKAKAAKKARPAVVEAAPPPEPDALNGTATAAELIEPVEHVEQVEPVEQVAPEPAAAAP